MNILNKQHSNARIMNKDVQLSRNAAVEIHTMLRDKNLIQNVRIIMSVRHNLERTLEDLRQLVAHKAPL